ADVGAASLQDLDDLRRIEQREQQVLDRDEFVALFPGLLERLVKAIFKLARQHQVSSMVHSSGCWFWRARPVTWATFVSAISYVYTPQTPFPLVCTSNMMRVAVLRSSENTFSRTWTTNSIGV